MNPSPVFLFLNIGKTTGGGLYSGFQGEAGGMRT